LINIPTLTPGQHQHYKSMAADLGEYAGDETDSHLRPKRLSFAAMGNDNTSSPVGTSSPITAATRTTPPHSALTLERPMLDNFMTPSPSSNNSPGMTASRQFGGLDHDIAKFAQSVSFLLSPY
jgi:hypothetical protein